MTTRNLRWCGNEPSADCRRSLDRADAARAAGRGDLAARLYDETITRCQGEDDLAGRTRAVLGAASVYVFGAEPGKLSAQLYDVLVRTTDDANRARLAAALARCWSYAGQAARAVQFADEALVRAQRVDQPELLADCLDAALAAHWGPDELDARVSLATRLDDVAAHVLDPDTRLQAALWGLQVACEARDFPAMHRHMRALEHIGEESPRAQFFAAADARPSAGRTDTSAHLVGMGATAAERAALPDAWMVLESMKGYTAVQSGDVAACATVAAECEAFALAEGAATVCARGGVPLASGRAAGPVPRPRAQLPRPCPRRPAPRRQLAAHAAMRAGSSARRRRRRDRGHGRAAARSVCRARCSTRVVGHAPRHDRRHAGHAAMVRGDPDTAVRLRDRALAAYERLGASWWRGRLAAWTPYPAGLYHRVRLHPTADGCGWWGRRTTPCRCEPCAATPTYASCCDGQAARSPRLTWSAAAAVSWYRLGSATCSTGRVTRSSIHYELG